MSWSRLREFVLPVGIIGCLLVFLVPLPAQVMDLLLAANIAIGLVVLLTTLYVRSPTEFTVFPTVLLATTLARLVLNVATTRLILTKADSVGLSAAGDVVRQFGQYVSGDRLMVGFVIFGIIFAIQWLVITKGATRISEVAARFSLDGIPGRQMAIDADLNAGVIDQVEAQHRREQLTRQADFYGAMDGASKFVRGDAIAGVIITALNIVGGLVIGITQGGLGLAEAAELYTKLTIGDGLVSQIPALLISLAAGLLVTRGSEATNLPSEFLKQLFTKPEVLAVAGVFLGLLVFTKLPTLPLVLLATTFLAFAYMAATNQAKQGTNERASGRASAEARTAPNRAVAGSGLHQASSANSKPTSPSPQRAGQDAKAKRLEDFLQVDVVELELGRSLVAVANANRGGDLLARIRATRERIASDLGLILPSVRVRDNLKLDEDDYAIRVLGNVVATGSLPARGQIVVPPVGTKSRSLPGAVSFAHPAVPKHARLLPVDRIGDAKAMGCELISTSNLITRHLQTVVYDLADELLTRDATKQLIDEVRRVTPTVVEELIPDVMKLSDVQQVLRGLLREKIPIRQLSTILEALGDYATDTVDTAQLIELTRRRLARTISARFQAADGLLHVVTLDPALEEQISSVSQDARKGIAGPVSNSFQTMLHKTLDRLRSENRTPILLTKSELRLAVLRLARVVCPEIVVLGQEELTADLQVRSVGIVHLV